MLAKFLSAFYLTLFLFLGSASLAYGQVDDQENQNASGEPINALDGPAYNWPREFLAQVGQNLKSINRKLLSGKITNGLMLLLR